MNLIRARDLKVGDRKEIERCGFWKVISVRLSPSGKTVYVKYENLPREYKIKAESLVKIR